MIERVVVVLYLLACIAIGVLASRRVLGCRSEYWVAGRSIGPWVNAMAIMAALASGGSILGVMGMTYKLGIPATLALFAGAVVGFPLASILVARPLRNFGRYTISDFLSFRYPLGVVRYGVPLLIVASFTAYIVAQMKAAGVAAEALLGIPYQWALPLAMLVFVLYVSFGGMVAVTWTDVVQGALMVLVVLGTGLVIIMRNGSPAFILAQATAASPDLGLVTGASMLTDLGAFLIWATAIPVIPHIVMRVYSAKDALGARMSLNLAMVLYCLVILAAVLVIVPAGKLLYPALADPDLIFLRIMESQFSPLVRGLAVAAVLAAVMSTTDALLLACSSAVAHDLLGGWFDKRGMGEKAVGWANVAVVWLVGLVAMALAYDPPELITILYTAAVGMLSAGLFVPVVAGLWWKRANAAGGAAALVVGVGIYLLVQFGPSATPETSTFLAGYGLLPPKMSAILFALPASALAMMAGAYLGTPDPGERLDQVARLHVDRSDLR